jgi:hypothetical protein
MEDKMLTPLIVSFERAIILKDGHHDIIVFDTSSGDAFNFVPEELNAVSANIDLLIFVWMKHNLTKL